ncbi:GspE/PulE family protein [Alicyclobacillus dauci]|uniref:ATPase, T2SS/T4P/T4SS family n=1 Tax=Alicyclobacillus dauci TaxID=1475485 RepID=A0ABY6Z7U0_9BACL|nr:ATPase, T2SS/T4P/T4SS family [Alicyclobacillus dauci]WAH38978.1 ATPase, T2SS/T4P/T4SS family [Alicyclobacillus dauci]
METFDTARLLQQTIDYAVHCNASDIHLTCINGRLQVNYRVGGRIRPFVHMTSRADEIIRRIKALARMDVTDKHSPQEGAFSWDVDVESVRMRVSSIPIYGGESVVIRLLRESTRVRDLPQLGLDGEQLFELTQLLDRDTGLVLVAGRTGVGKTTTLYGLMNYLARQGRQVFSIEDPVEAPVPNCRQIEVREQTGLTYEASLRALLRQDPDVLMIGEIRDRTTAGIAVRAALTGRLVLATAHAASARSAVNRLLDLGVPSALLDETLQAILVQEGPSVGSIHVSKHHIRKLGTVSDSLSVNRLTNENIDWDVYAGTYHAI